MSQPTNALEEVLRRLLQWDMFNPPNAAVCADAPYWVAEITNALRSAAPVSEEIAKLRDEMRLAADDVHRIGYRILIRRWAARLDTLLSVRERGERK